MRKIIFSLALMLIAGNSYAYTVYGTLYEHHAGMLPTGGYGRLCKYRTPNGSVDIYMKLADTCPGVWTFNH